MIEEAYCHVCHQFLRVGDKHGERCTWRAEQAGVRYLTVSEQEMFDRALRRSVRIVHAAASTSSVNECCQSNRMRRRK